MYGHSIKTEAKRNNVSCQKQGQQNRDNVSQRILEKGFEVSQKLRQIFWETGYCFAKIQNSNFY